MERSIDARKSAWDGLERKNDDVSRFLPSSLDAPRTHYILPVNYSTNTERDWEQVWVVMSLLRPGELEVVLTRRFV